MESNFAGGEIESVSASSLFERSSKTTHAGACVTSFLSPRSLKMIIDHFAGDESPSLAPARSAAIFSAGTDIEITSGGSINIANNYSQAGGSIFMNAAKDINYSNYTVQADDDIVMNATNINNISTATSAAAASANPTKIDAGNMVSLNATNDITNLGATIKGGDLVYLTAGNDITNKALIDYRIDGVSATESEVVNSNANNIRSTLVAQGIIESAGNIILVANNDINNQGSKITSAGSALLEATNGDINITTSILRDRTVSSGGSRKKNGGERTLDNTINLQSEITSGADLFLTSGNDITLEAAKLRAGTDSSSPSSTLNISAGNNLLITTATDSAYKSESIKKNGTFTFKNTDSGYINTTVLNTELSTGSTPSASGVSLSSGNATYAEFKSGSDQSLDAKLAYLKSLDPNTAILNPINEMHDSWNTKVSGLNQTGTIVVALTASLATGGALGFGIVGAMAGTAAATASVSATNASLNREGSFLGTLDDVGKTAFKDTTSKQTVKNVMVAGVTAGIIQGVGELAKTKDVANAANTAKTASNAATVANTANTTSTAATAASNVTTTANTANSITTATTTASTANTAIGTTQRVLTNLGTATTKIAINTAAYTIANSTINGESIQDSLKDQDTKLLVAQLLGEVGAKEIGLAAHTGKISQKTQLILHAGLGCGLSAGAGGGCASGAAAGVASEFLADKAYSNGVDAQNSILIGQATGAGAALLVSATQGRDDDQTAKNVSLGSFVGVNAATYNATLISKEGKILAVEKDGDKGVYVDNNDGGSRKDKLVGKTEYIDEFLVPETGKITNKPSYIHVGQSVDSMIESLSNQGGGSVGGPDVISDLIQLKHDSYSNQKFDIKQQLGAFDGYLLDGYYISGRSAGNYLAGVNGVKSGMPETLIMMMSGQLHNPSLSQVLNPPYYGEIPYAGRRIEQGIHNTRSPSLMEILSRP